MFVEWIQEGEEKKRTIFSRKAILYRKELYEIISSIF
jgi:hypothetical protein